MKGSIPYKKIKLSEQIIEQSSNLNKIMVELKNSLNQSIGNFQLSTSTTPKQLQQILNNLLKETSEEQNQYSEFTFFHNQKQIKTKLEIFLKNIKFDSQHKFQIVYHPVAHYKVKPITRSSASLMGHTESVLCTAFSPSSDMLATGSGDTTVRIWDLNTETPLKEVKGSNWIMVLVWAPNNKKFAFGENNGIIRVYNVEQNHTTTLKGHTKWITSLSWEPLHLNEQCNRLISASKDASLRIWNTDSGVCLRAFGNHTKCVTKLIWGGENMIYSCSQDQTIKAWNNGGQFKLQFQKHAHWVNTMALSTDFVLKKGCYQNDEQVPDTPAKQKAKALQLYNKAIKTHRQRLVTGSDDHTLMLFQPPNKNPIKRLVGHQQPVNHVQFSPDGRYIISASFDKSLKLWDGYTGEFMFTFKGHVGAVYQVAWSCDSRYLVSGSKDSTMKVWDIKTRKLMYELPGHADQVYAIDWSSDGVRVASGGKDRQVKIWRN